MTPPVDVQILAAICRRAGALAITAVRGPVENKGDGSPVTEVDRAVERLIARELRDWIPDIPMVGEEGGGRPAAAVTPASQVQVCALVPSDVHRRYSLALPGRVRSLGSTAYHLALVATGSALAAVVHESYPWDGAGVMPMLARADVVAATLDGAALDLRGHLDGGCIEGPMLVAPRWAWEDLAPTIQPLPTGEPLAAAHPCGG